MSCVIIPATQKMLEEISAGAGVSSSSSIIYCTISWYDSLWLSPTFDLIYNIIPGFSQHNFYPCYNIRIHQTLRVLLRVAFFNGTE